MSIKNIFISSIAILTFGLSVQAQIEPTFIIGDPISLFAETNTKEAGLALNTQSSEVLFVTIDEIAIENDPITGEPAQQAVTGFYYNTETLEPIGDPFVIVGNPRGNLQKLTVTYNPVSNRYFVAVAADGYSPSGARVPLMAIVNPSTEADPLFKVWNWDPETTQNYQDTAVAASTNNGNLMYISEYSPEGESEGVIGLLYDQDGNLLTTGGNTRLDSLEATRDEDDPDVYFLPESDIFFFITNIDPSTSANRISGRMIQPTAGADGLLQLGEQRVFSELRKPFNAGHPSAIENPFTGEFIGALDYDNGAEGGDLFYFNIGPAPDFQLTESQPQIPYLEAVASDPFTHRHPRFALDRNSGVFVVSHNAQGGFQGMVFTLLGPDGQILPGRPDDLYKLNETAAPVDQGANWHDVQYDPISDSFLIIYATTGGQTFVQRLTITSDHTDGIEPPTAIEDWMLLN